LLLLIRSRHWESSWSLMPNELLFLIFDEIDIHSFQRQSSSSIDSTIIITTTTATPPPLSPSNESESTEADTVAKEEPITMHAAIPNA